MQSFDLTAKVIVITGAANGIGRQCAKDLASLGATIVATDIDVDGINEVAAQIVNAGGKAQGLQHDVTSEGDWGEAIKICQEQYGRLDVLINNAGTMLQLPFSMTSYEEFKNQQRINVDSVFLGCKAAYQLMADSGAEGHGSSIINLSSIYGQIGGPIHSAYCASKGAVRMLSKSLAVELGRMNTKIRVNSVHPGPTDTGLARGALDNAERLGLLSRAKDAEEAYSLMTTAFPMGRWGQAEDVAGAIAFLASDASRFVTGAELVVDGGYSIV